MNYPVVYRLTDEDVQRMRISLLRKWERDPTDLDALIRGLLKHGRMPNLPIMLEVDSGWLDRMAVKEGNCIVSTGGLASQMAKEPE